jgi:hypothetical protein
MDFQQEIDAIKKRLAAASTTEAGVIVSAII